MPSNHRSNKRYFKRKALRFTRSRVLSTPPLVHKCVTFANFTKMSLLYLFNLISLRHPSYNIRNADYIRKSNLSNTTHAFRFLMQLSNISQLLRHLTNLCFTLNKRVFLVFLILYNDKICRFQLKIKLPAVFFWLLLLSKLLLASCHEI